MKKLFVIGLLALFLVSCQTSSTTTPPPTPPAILFDPSLPVPTLPPTFTPGRPVTPSPLDTRPPLTPQPTNTPIDFSQPVLTVRYVIPAVGLDRSLAINVAGNVSFEDVNTGRTNHLNNQTSVALELQGILTNLILLPLPEGCTTCVQFSFELPVEGKSGSGWLQQDILLASFENFFVTGLGPHFPPNTIVGLHRQPSIYKVGHTVAILADGSYWGWEATSAELPPAGQVDLETINQLLEQTPVNVLETKYTVACPGYAEEFLYLTQGEITKTISLTCPELALPSTSTDLYQTVSDLAEDVLDPERNLAYPSLPLTLDMVLYYRRSDGAILEIYADGRAIGYTPDLTPQEKQIPAETLTPLLQTLVTSGVIPRGVQTILTIETVEDIEDLLLVRGELGVYEFSWTDNIGPGLVPAIGEVEQLLVELAGVLSTPTPAATTPITATVTITPSVTITSTTPITP
jgi:hypothetical protein